MLSKLSPPFLNRFFLLAVGAALLVSPVAGTDHIVGANKGWNPGINYTLWANNQTFYVGDYISFRYKKSQHNVFEVSKTGYENCTTEGAKGNWSNGKDFIQLKKPGRYYFICGIGGCLDGMKVSIVVHSLPPPPSASVTATKHSTEATAHGSSGAAGVTSRQGLLVAFKGLVVGFVSYVLIVGKVF